jgi:DNA-directed RNA polymerase III subunit RPC5
MTIKTTSDGDLVTTETIADRLRSVQSEPWRKLRYVDENDEAAWNVYNDSLFLRPGTEENTGEDNEVAEKKSLEGLVPGFGIRWGDKELLEAVSGIKKPEPEPEIRAEAKKDLKDNQAQQAIKSEATGTRKPKPRTRGGGTAGGVRMGGRAKPSAPKAAAE